MTWNFPFCDGLASLLDQSGRAACIGVAIQWHLAAKGSFQAVKLQRPARTTVCSHSKLDMPPRVPSNQSTILTTPSTSVCPVVDSCEDLSPPPRYWRWIAADILFGVRT